MFSELEERVQEKYFWAKKSHWKLEKHQKKSENQEIGEKQEVGHLFSKNESFYTFGNICIWTEGSDHVVWIRLEKLVWTRC